VRLRFEDEARFGRLSDPRRCWAPAGGRPEVNTPLVRADESAFAAVSPHDGARDTLVLPWAHTEARGVFLAEVSQRHPDEFLLRVLDGAGGHKAKHLPVPAHRKRISLPAWSPPWNPVEHRWDEGREKWFRNRVFASRTALEEQRVTALTVWEEDPQRVASLTGFDWIRSIPLNAN
jgi:hypothetical protein